MSGRIIIPLFLALALLGCHRGHPIAELAEADSLLTNRQEQKALEVLQGVNSGQLNKADQAYYALLITQARYKCYVPATSDSMINVAVEYYSRNGDTEKHTRSLIYQGGIYEELGQLESAAGCYHEAESTAEPTDLYNRAYAKMRLGYLYQHQIIGSKTIALRKFQDASHLFRTIREPHYELLCLSEIGIIYRNIDVKHDSAVIVLNEAIKLSRQLNDRYLLFANLFSLSEFYSVRKQDYDKGKELALEALSAGGELIDHPRAHFRLAQDYLELGQIDSAQHYIRLAPSPVSAADSILFYEVLTKLEHAQGNEALSMAYFKRADAMDDSVLMAGLNHRLLAVEKKYDTQKVELKNAQLASQRLRLLLGLVIALLAIVVTVWGAMRLRVRLKNKTEECDQVKCELRESMTQLKGMEKTLEQLATSARVKEEESLGMKRVVKQQLQVVEQLMQWSRQFSGTKFMDKFYSVMTLPDNVSAKTYWTSLHELANELHDNVLERARHAAGGTLREDEVNYLALFSCGFNASVIMVCMRYKNIGTVYNKRSELTRKLHVNDLREFVEQ